MAKAFFKEHNVQYEEYNVAEDQARRTEMIQMTGQLGVPVIAIDDMLMVGFSQAKVAEMLGITA
jgi:glutaredoxin